MIVEFARAVGDRENLHNLYLLTFADIRASSKAGWTEWKGQLLHELYERTAEFLETGEDDPERALEQIEERVEARRARGAARSSRASASASTKIEAYFADMPRRYFTAHTPAPDRAPRPGGDGLRPGAGLRDRGARDARRLLRVPAGGARRARALRDGGRLPRRGGHQHPRLERLHHEAGARARGLPGLDAAPAARRSAGSPGKACTASSSQVLGGEKPIAELLRAAGRLLGSRRLSLARAAHRRDQQRGVGLLHGDRRDRRRSARAAPRPGAHDRRPRARDLRVEGHDDPRPGGRHLLREGREAAQGDRSGAARAAAAGSPGRRRGRPRDG